MKRILFFVIAVVSLAILIAACQPETVEVTRVVTETEVQEVEVTRVVTEVVEGEAMEVTRVVEVPVEEGEKTVINFWTTDNEEERVELYEEVAARFMAENPDIDLRILPITEAEVSQRIATAQAANRLPDIVRMGVERVSLCRRRHPG